MAQAIEFPYDADVRAVVVPEWNVGVVVERPDSSGEWITMPVNRVTKVL